jgi:ParB-like chromosome segregation protein Spo0J
MTGMIAENLLQIQYKSPSELVEYARNPRQKEAVVDKMCSAIREFGFRIPIVARSDGGVVDGHLRLKAAKKLGLEMVRSV